ncbi:MAG: GWxTD domain-containing protein [Candidatus Acidiferrales bacterium]
MLRLLSRFAVLALVFAIILGFTTPPLSAKEKEKLPPQYKEWLDRDAAYIITRGEKSDFFKLKTDAERDKFIEYFWEIRNPDPSSPINAYKEEHYKRLAYADDHFGIGKRVPGWATERGHMYIVLGEPKQMATYQGLDRVRPMQIWFYESVSPTLPPFFYVVFYKQDSFGDYRTYSPYFDGPQQLVTERGIDDLSAIKMIQRDAGQEVARISLSLLPDEPVNTQNPIRSMQSDVMMSVIHDLANSPMNVQDLQRRAALMTVTSRLLVGGETMGILTTPLRDAEGNIKVHYLLRLRKPEDFALGKGADGGYYFSVESRVQVYGPDDKLIFTQERSLKHTVSPEQVEQVKTKLFGYEGWLPLPPGKYHLKFLLTNWVNTVGYQGEMNIVVPDIPSSGVAITPMIPFSSVQNIQPELSGMVPFSSAGLKFSPVLARELYLSQATNLQFFYQIWAGQNELFKANGGDLEARYAFGRPGAVGQAQVLTDQVSRAQFDPTGTMLTGKKIPLGELPHGNYLLTLTLNSPDGRQKASGTMIFHLMSEPPNDADWDVFDGEGIAKDVRNGTTDYQRGLCYLAFGEKDNGARWLRNALDKNPRLEEARSALVNMEFGRADFPALAKLAHDVPVTSDTDDETILRLAEALDKTGGTQDAINLLQTAIKLKSPDGPIYLTLAGYYRRIGDPKKGDDFEKRGREMIKSTPAAKAPTTKE